MFKYDLLLIDIESTGTDTAKHEIIQLAAVLLDKKTLKEKMSFNSYVRPKKWQKRDPEAMAVNKVNFEVLKNAPDIKTVLEKFVKTCPKRITLANYGGSFDISFLTTAFKLAKIPYPFDYHTFDIWVPAYLYMAKRGLLNDKTKYHGFGISSFIKTERIKEPEGKLHEALTDCRAEADILRYILKHISL